MIRVPPSRSVWSLARIVAALAASFVLAAVVAPRLVNAHDTSLLLLALVLYILASLALGWSLLSIVSALRRRRSRRYGDLR